MSNAPKNALSNEGEARRYRVSPRDRAEFERRARCVMNRPTIHAQAQALYPLYLDFLRAASLGGDFPRWLSLHSGKARMTCYNRMRLALALAVTTNPAQTQAALLAELRALEQTPVELPCVIEPERRRPRQKRRKKRVKPAPPCPVHLGLAEWARGWAAVGWSSRLHRDAQAYALLELRAMWTGSGLGTSFCGWLHRTTGLPRASVYVMVAEAEAMKQA